MTEPHGRASVLAVAMFVWAIGAGAQAHLPAETARWLETEFGFSGAELQAVAEGRSVARALDTTSASEAAAVGVVRIDAPSERLLREFAEPDTATLARGVQALGVFSDPPVPADLAGLRLTTEDLAALRECRPGACDVKLPRDVIARMREVPWHQADAPALATAVMRDWLLASLQRYRAEGASALGRLDDKRPSIDAGAELATVLANEPLLSRVAPELAAYLSGRSGRPRGDREVVYWARVDFGLKPLIRVSHLSVHETPGAAGGVSHVVVGRQLYASHYVRGALELRLIVPQPGGGFLLVTTSRSRNDGMTGLRGLVVRASVRRRSRDVLARYLEAVKAATEANRRGGIVGK